MLLRSKKLRKLLTLVLVLVVTSFLAGLYGIIHDQITYSISNEYYTKLKFIQFGLENWGLGQNIGTQQFQEIKLTQPRFGVSIVGFLATWWVGLITGIVLGLVGLIHKSAKEMLKITMKAATLTIGAAIIAGVIGFLYGKLILANSEPTYLLPQNVTNQSDYLVVGTIHNFSYLGGVVGMIIGIIYSVRSKKHTNYDVATP